MAYGVCANKILSGTAAWVKISAFVGQDNPRAVHVRGQRVQF